VGVPIRERARRPEQQRLSLCDSAFRERDLRGEASTPRQFIRPRQARLDLAQDESRPSDVSPRQKRFGRRELPAPAVPRIWAEPRGSLEQPGPQDRGTIGRRVDGPSEPARKPLVGTSRGGRAMEGCIGGVCHRVDRIAERTMRLDQIFPYCRLIYR
jgi:hypothetical protein